MRDLNIKSADILPRYAPSQRLRYGEHIKTFNERIMTTYGLPIEIEHALPNWFLVEEVLHTLKPNLLTKWSEKNSR
jgi:hypothetical protein